MIMMSIGRDTEKLIEYIQSSGFMTAPSSTKYHSSYAGGLIVHSLNVYHTFMSLAGQFGLILPVDTIKICGLFHDICKAKLYVEQEGKYIYDKNEIRNGHGKYSVQLLNDLVGLTDQEREIIGYHMGPYGAVEAFPYGEYTMKQLIEVRNKDAALALFHYADNIATQFLE